VLVVGAIYYYIAFTNLVDLEKVLEDVSHALGAWTYLLVAVFAFAETGAFVGLLVPGETVMILGGATAGQGATDIYLLIAIAWVCAFAGDSTSFFVGRRLGREFLMRHGPRFGIGEERLAQVDDYFERHGGKTIFLGRFVGFVRAFAPFIAGSSGMRYRGFVPYSILGTGCGSAARSLIGYLFSRSIDTAANTPAAAPSLLGTLIVDRRRGRLRRLPRRREPARGGALDGGHARPAGWSCSRAASARSCASSGTRVTPGGTFGLEFTSLMATSPSPLRPRRLHGDRQRRPGPDPGDETAIDVVESLQAGWLVDVAKAVTALGSARSSCRWRDLRGLLGVRAAGRGRRACSPAWRSSSSASTSSRSPSTAPGRGRLVGTNGIVVPQRPRRLLDLLRLAGGDGW
jgi:undecaprenyl-diphosphatase